MSESINIAVMGVSGRMGRMILKAVEESESTSLIGVTEVSGHSWIGCDVGKLTLGMSNGVQVSDDPITVFKGADAVIDFTHPEASVNHSVLAAQARTVHVIGTTGFTNSQQKKLSLAAQHAPIIRAGNMSLGVNLLTQITKVVAASLDTNFDIEILETHHNKKIDAPSGTALMLGEAAAEGRKTEIPRGINVLKQGLTQERENGSINFSSMRGGDVVGEHSVNFLGAGERIVLSHVATDRMIFARGAVKAALWGFGKEPAEYNMLDVLGLGSN